MNKIHIIIATIILLFVILFFFKMSRIHCFQKGPPEVKNSQNIEESKRNKVFLFELSPNKTSFQIDSASSFQIKKAWLENIWFNECISDNWQIVKLDKYQFLVEISYKVIPNRKYIYIGNKLLNNFLVYRNYVNLDTIKIPIYMDTSLSFKFVNKTTAIDTIKFFRQ